MYMTCMQVQVYEIEKHEGKSVEMIMEMDMEHDGDASDSINTIDDGPGDLAGCGGGLQRWGSVVGVWICWLLRRGVVKALGVMLPVLETQFAASAWLIGWIVAMTVGVIDISGPFAGVLGKRFGAGRVVMVSGLMVGGALIMASCATSALQIALVLTIFAGPGLGIPLVLMRQRVAQCYTKGYGTATAIGQTGTSVAMVVFGPLANLFLFIYGWRGTMLLLGGISLHLVVSGALIYTAPPGATDDYRSLPTTDKPLSGEDALCEPAGRPKSPRPCLTSLGQSLIKEFDLELFVSFSYWMVVIVVVSEMFAFEMWYIYFESHAKAKGFAPSVAGYFVLVAGVGNLFGKAISGVANYCNGRRLSVLTTLVLAISLVLSAIPLMATPFIHGFWAMMAATFVYACSGGVTVALGEVLSKDVLGPERLASAFGWMGIKAGLLRFAVGYFPGWIYDCTGSYDISFVVLGFVYLIALGALGALKWTNRYDR